MVYLNERDTPQHEQYIENFFDTSDQRKIGGYIGKVNVLISIKKFYEKKGKWPVQKELSEMAGIEKSTISNIVKELHNNELIKRSPRPSGGLYCCILSSFLSNFRAIEDLITFSFNQKRYGLIYGLIKYFDYVELLSEFYDKSDRGREEFIHRIPDELFDIAPVAELLSEKICSSKGFREECTRLCEFLSSEDRIQKIIAQRQDNVPRSDIFFVELEEIAEGNYFGHLELSKFFEKLYPQSSMPFIRERMYPYLEKLVNLLVEKNTISPLYGRILLLSGWLQPHDVVEYLYKPFLWKRGEKVTFRRLFLDRGFLPFLDLFHYAFIFDNEDREKFKERHSMIFNNFGTILKVMGFSFKNKYRINNMIFLYNFSDLMASKLYEYVEERHEHCDSIGIEDDFLVTSIENGFLIKNAKALLERSGGVTKSFYGPVGPFLENNKLVSRLLDEKRSIEEIKEELQSC